jgi:hypothetical protein
MSDRIPVFDSFGERLGDIIKSTGEYIPISGDSGYIGFVILLFILSIAIIGYVLYYSVMLLIKGLKAIGQKKWGLAFICFIPIWLPVLVLVIANTRAWAENQEYNNRRNARITQMANAQDLFTVAGAKLLQDQEIIWDIQPPAIVFTLKNQTVYQASAKISAYCVSPDISGGDKPVDIYILTVKPGEEHKLVCGLNDYSHSYGDPDTFFIDMSLTLEDGASLCWIVNPYLGEISYDSECH